MLEFINHLHVTDSEYSTVDSLEYNIIGATGVISLRPFTVQLFRDPRPLALIAVNKLLYWAEPQPTFDQTTFIQASNRIGLETRRGVGNTIIYHPDDFAAIRAKLPDYLLDSYNKYPVSVHTLKGRMLLRYKSRFKDIDTVNRDGRPIMVIGQAPPDILGAPCSNAIGWIEHKADTFLKAFTI